jgi:hypothetical protein
MEACPCAQRPHAAGSTATIQDGPAFYICVSPNVPFFGEEGRGDALLITRQSKTQCRQKNIRYVKATCEGEERERRLAGLVGYDEAHDAQWWLDHIDADRRAANWDDKRGAA